MPAFQPFTGNALRALNAQDGAPSPFGPNIIGGPEQRIGDLLNAMIDMINRSPVVTVSASNATGGSTDSDFALNAKDINGSDLESAVQLIVVAQADQYDPELSPDATASFGTATTGTIVDSGAGWALIETDANGNFECTLANSADETLYVSATAPIGGAEDTDKAAFQVVSNSDAVSWSA
jgi:hypothetical protein